ncbi:unnamed protein product [Clavelina lepadiformis]|uniref:Uncharacterized protein n=1 Tax=Clavelina lepadiformis TaxID=159417 RepID=A0ABP0FEK2_CLALP
MTEVQHLQKNNYPCYIYWRFACGTAKGAIFGGQPETALSTDRMLEVNLAIASSVSIAVAQVTIRQLGRAIQ